VPHIGWMIQYALKKQSRASSYLYWVVVCDIEDVTVQKEVDFKIEEAADGDLAEYIRSAHKAEHDGRNKRSNLPAESVLQVQIFPSTAERWFIPHVFLKETESSRGAGQSPSRPRRRSARLVAV
jgi:hypothetical protein